MQLVHVSWYYDLQIEDVKYAFILEFLNRIRWAKQPFLIHWNNDAQTMLVNEETVFPQDVGHDMYWFDGCPDRVTYHKLRGLALSAQQVHLLIIN